jgi:poly(3-hydroxybutyrate) depolymerase
VHLPQYGDGVLQPYEVEGGGHTWPGGLQYASEAILSFFAAHAA